jgi:hypothetical protein
LQAFDFHNEISRFLLSIFFLPSFYQQQAVDNSLNQRLSRLQNVRAYPRCPPGSAKHEAGSPG